MTRPTFDVSKKGLAKTLTRRPIEFVVLELIQNALDEDSTRVEVGVHPVPDKRGLYTLHVEDDNPEGFKDLSHAYTLFAESLKGSNPDQRGRYNLGEKLVIAVCQYSYIRTTTGTVEFKDDQRFHRRERTEKGSIFHGEIRLKKDDLARIEEAVRQTIMPPGIEIWFNGRMNDEWRPEKTFEATLATEKTDEEGYLRRTRRKTKIEVYEADGEAQLYEMGIPVVAIDCAWHINVCQKVPLNVDRDNVTPAYMRELLALVLNEMHEELDEDNARSAWVDEALETGDINNDAVDAVLTARYGEKRVVADPSDPEGTKLAVSKGYSVIQAGSFNKAQWENIRQSGAVLPAGKVTPSPKAWSDDPDAKMADYIPEDKWSPGMKRVAVYARRLAYLLMDESSLTVSYVRVPNNWSACYGPGELTFNLRWRSKQWFEDAHFHIEDLDSLLIHEFGHHYSSDHLSKAYHRALCDLGAKLKSLAMSGKLREPVKKLKPKKEKAA